MQLFAVVAVAFALLVLRTTASAVGPPVVTGVTPVAGNAGTTVTINGGNFTGATAVMFGQNPATTFNILNDVQMTAVAPAGSGVVHVTVTNPDGTSTAGVGDQFTYSVLPTITSLTPSQGPTTGGTQVTITGSGFLGATYVLFGAATVAFNAVSDTQITAISPPGSNGSVNVTVGNALGQSAASAGSVFTYGSPVGIPTISSVSPNSGPTAGGTLVTITGTGFTGTTAVTFGANVATFTVLNQNQISATSPAGGPGTVDVRVTNGFGTSQTVVADQFTYGTLPAIFSVVPNNGPTTGGTTVTINGASFTGLQSVTFGGTPAQIVSIVDNQIVVTSPAHAAGSVDVRVTTLSGISPITAADLFTYGTFPVVTSVTPNNGPTSGGTVVTIIGSGFTGVTAVMFSDAPAANYTLISDAQIVATTPAHFAAVTDVRVTTGAGTSANTFVDNFTFGTFPVVTAVTPNSGPTIGGNIVTVAGSGFTGVNAISFGGTPAITYTLINDGSIVVTVPAHASGTVDVLVSTPAGTSANTAADNYTYGTLPTVVSATPNNGPVAGGTPVSVSGSGFTGAITVTIGGVSVPFTVLDDNTLVFTAPAHAAGVVDIRVTTPSGISANSVNDNYTYGTNIPVITSVAPNSGPAEGGTLVVITGTGFTGATDVLFGTLDAASFTVVSDTRINAVSPAGLTGQVQIRVITPNGTSATVAAAIWTVSGETVTYTLYFRWSLVAWVGQDGINVATALMGQGGGANITPRVTAIYRWDGPGQDWEAYFPSGVNIPGANDFTTLTKGRSYWIAITAPGPVNWTVFSED
ncbi:hypothetical protein AYO38_02925 [bacterium SCGC AG-212-C10]|nr:hypothetical protein AYO38_02925 [bacterium SCGC AG-212-C10]